jgi:hypothetical protein
LRVANLTNKLRREYAGKCKSKPFSYLGYWFWQWLHVRNWWIADNAIKTKILKARYPTLLKNITSKYIPYLHAMKNEHNTELWVR